MGKFSYLLCLVQLAVVCHASLPQFPSRPQELPQFQGKYSGRIVGGDLVRDCSIYPYQVSIQRKSLITEGFNHFCGGSIISEHFILTTGRCVDRSSPASISILAGTPMLDTTGQEGVRRNAANIIIHQGYDPANRDNDIAVIKLDQPLDLSSNCLSAISLPTPNEEIQEGTMCFATGWGTTTEGGSSLSPTLRVVGVPIVSQEACIKSYVGADVTERMICAGLKEGGKGTCLGDDGGPLVCDGKLAGITSWRYGCARPELYGVYSRVAYFIDWINVHITAKQ